MLYFELTSFFLKKIDHTPMKINLRVELRKIIYKPFQIEYFDVGRKFLF